MILADPERTDTSPEANHRRSCMHCWQWICQVLKGPKALEYADYDYEFLAFSGDWDHIGEPQLDTRKRGKVDPGRVWIDVSDSFKLARKRRVKRCRQGPIRLLKHGRTVPSEVPGFSLRHQRPAEVVEVRTTCGTWCEDREHIYPDKHGRFRLTNVDRGLDGDDEGSDAWLNWKWAAEVRRSEITADDDDDDDSSGGEEL